MVEQLKQEIIKLVRDMADERRIVEALERLVDAAFEDGYARAAEELEDQ